MANMSANILRNLVSSVFNVKATKVRLSGDISPEYKGYSVDACIAGYSTTEKVWAFNAQKGFRQLNCVANTQYYNGGCDSYFHDAPVLGECLVEGDIFVLIFSDSDSPNYDDNTSWNLFKAPDFQEWRKNVEAQDLTRWESWLNA